MIKERKKFENSEYPKIQYSEDSKLSTLKMLKNMVEEVLGCGTRHFTVETLKNSFIQNGIALPNSDHIEKMLSMRLIRLRKLGFIKYKFILKNKKLIKAREYRYFIYVIDDECYQKICDYINMKRNTN